jgi:hypothetical protein
VSYDNCEFTNCIINDFVPGLIFRHQGSDISKYEFNTYTNCFFKNCVFQYTQFSERYESCKFNNNQYLHATNSWMLNEDKAFNALPSGDLTVYKKAVLNHTKEGKKEYCVVELQIPADAQRIKGNTNKCRASKVKVVKILNLEGQETNVLRAYSHYINQYVAHSEYTEYVVGEEVLPDFFDDNPLYTCSHGIHFFCTFKEAANYDFN